MSKNKIVLIIGILLLLIPLTGFPSSWKSFMHIAFGLILIALSFSNSLKRRSAGRKSVRTKKETSTPVSLAKEAKGQTSIEAVQKETSNMASQ